MSEDRAAMIHEASLALLESPGVRIEHDAICRKLLDQGARQGSASEVVRFPRQLITECLDLCPREVTLAGRGGGDDDGVSILHCHGSGGLPGHMAGGYNQFFSTDFSFNALFH